MPAPIYVIYKYITFNVLTYYKKYALLKQGTERRKNEKNIFYIPVGCLYPTSHHWHSQR